MRLEPNAIRMLAGRLERGSVVISATNGKTTTAAMVASILGRTGAPARAQPRRREHGRRRGVGAGRRGAARRARARRRPRACSRSTSSGSARWSRSSSRGRCCSATSSATSSTATASSRRSPTAGRRSSPPAATAPRSCSTPTTRWSPTSGATREPVYFGVEDDRMAHAELQHASDSKHCRRCGHPYVYDAAYLAPPGPLPLPELRRRAGRSRAWPPTDVRLDGIRSAAFTLRTRQRRGAGRAPAPRPLQRLQRARRRRPVPALGVAAGRRRRRAAAPSRPRSGAPRRSTWPAARPRSCSSRTRPGRTRCCARWRSSGGELDVLGVLNDRIADGRDVSWVWDADWEVLAPHVRRMTCAGTRAAELALRMKYAGVATERLHVVEALPDGARRGARRGRRAALRPAHLHGAARAARPARPARPGGGVLAMTRAATELDPGTPLTCRRPRSSSGTTSSAAATRRTCRCGARSRARPAGRSSTSARAPGRVALRPRPRRATP